ncbi:RDD family protein [Arthrobacter cavernae]|uniref:RDD family protein n=1 Tax=Arthrobacter cavernae TaxID=2817681 RepID=A0A939KKS4_9MICC|nr:RDD family protein [Arthrobacter cavernae]MBO1266503.1 RDD family protein [Arthrobacter cavernae]
MSPIITGEAVVLELRPASFGVRALGLVLDVIVHTVLLIGLILLIGMAAGELDEAALRALVLVAVVFSFVIVPVAVETITRGRSLGKFAAGLRIVRDDGGSIRFRHAVIRGLLGFVEVYLTFGGLAIAVALFSDKSKRLGDVAAGTYSLRLRVPAERRILSFAPPYLQAWVSSADIGRVPDATARRAAQFVQQAHHMAPASRDSLAASLATELAAYVAPPPPAGTRPEDYLGAVLGERRNRELARLQRTEERSAAIAGRLNKLPFQQ